MESVVVTLSKHGRSGEEALTPRRHRPTRTSQHAFPKQRTLPAMSTAISVIWYVAWIAFGIYCVMDVQKHSEEAFQAAGTPKQTALILTIVGILCCGFVNLYYYFVLRPKVEQAEQGGAGGYPGGYPPAV
jgi:hypothetical protein